MNSLVQVLLLLIVIGGSVGLFFVVRRQRYLRSLTEQGWAFENSPTLAATYGLNCPPFGLGYGRHIDDLITGGGSILQTAATLTEAGLDDALSTMRLAA